MSKLILPSYLKPVEQPQKDLLVNLLAKIKVPVATEVQELDDEALETLVFNAVSEQGLDAQILGIGETE